MFLPGLLKRARACRSTVCQQPRALVALRRGASGKTLAQLPGTGPLAGEKQVSIDAALEAETGVWHRLPSEIQASLLKPCPDGTIGFKGWLGKEHSDLLEASDFKGRAGVYKLFTDAEAKALIDLTGTEAGKNIPSKEDTAKRYVGRYNTLRQAVKDRWLTGALWQRLSERPGELTAMEYWGSVVGANSDLRLVRTQPPRGEGEKAGQHLKHVDTREDNRDFVDERNLDLHTRISIITVQCYLNPEEHEGGEFTIWPARLNLADPSNEKETILFEEIPESNPDLVPVRVRLKDGEAVIFHQDTDQCYHGGAPVTGDRDKVALRFVLDMKKTELVDNPEDFYKQPEYGMGFTNDRSSINVNRETADSARNTINCVVRQRRIPS